MCVCDTKNTEIWEPPKPVNIPNFIHNGGRYKRPSTVQRWENRWNGIGNGPGGKRMYGRGGRNSIIYGAGAGSRLIHGAGAGSSLIYGAGASSSVGCSGLGGAGADCGGGSC